MLRQKIKIRNVFRMANGVTALVCDQPKKAEDWVHREVEILNQQGEIVEKATILNKIIMSGRNVNNEIVALQVRGKLAINEREAQSGDFFLSFF